MSEDFETQTKRTVKKREWIAGNLEAVPFVQWDRFTVGERDGYQYVDVYGWIDREKDEYKDFVWARFWPKTEFFEYTTSSDKYSEKLGDVWFGDEEGEVEHYPCRRVEHTFDIPNAIELHEQATLADGGELRCGYCDGTDLVYELRSDKGVVTRCIECLAIEQGQQQFSRPFEAWIDRDEVDPPEGADAPDFDPFDPREHDYKTAQAWLRILARLKDDEPIIKRDPEAIGTVFEDTREFLINVMGADAHKRPSELIDDE